MDSPSLAVLAIGAVGQGLFLARALFQWVASERAGRVVVPRLYWYLSVCAAALVLFYAFAVHNPIYVLSVTPGALIALRNLRLSHSSPALRLLPWAVLLAAVVLWSVLARPRVGPTEWALVGLAGSLLWSTRWLFQWWVSERRGVSSLPRGFWLSSLAGGVLLSAYAVSRWDAVMLSGYAFGCIPAVRNLLLLGRAPDRRAMDDSERSLGVPGPARS